MKNTSINLFEHILKYEENIVHIAFDNKNSKPYFHANQLCQILEYNDCKQAIQINVKKNDIVYLKDIVKNYKILYKNVQGNTKFLSEEGMYSLILSSKKEKAKEITNWITHEVMPSLRKYGEYKLNHKYKKQIDELNKVLYEQKNKIKILEHNLRKPKYDKGGMVYILRIINDKLNLDENEILYLKFGRTKNMNKRKPLYDTCTHNQVQILKTLYVDDPKNIEQCVIKRMEQYKVKDRKEYFKCSYNQIIEEIASCINFYEHNIINKQPDIELNRQNINFNDNQILFKILNDNEYDDICELNNTESDEDYNSDSDNENENVQKGGCDDNYQKYLQYKLKYLQLKYEFI